MNDHRNARLTPRGREVLISRLKRGEHPQDVGAAMAMMIAYTCAGARILHGLLARGITRRTQAWRRR